MIPCWYEIISNDNVICKYPRVYLLYEIDGSYIFLNKLFI